MEKQSRRPRWVLAGGAFIASIVAMIAFAVPSFATSTHSIDGTVYEGGSYFLSSTVRTVSGSYVQVKLNQVPSRGIKWRLYSVNKGTYFAGPVSWNNNSAQTIATNVANGTKFENSFAEGSGSCHTICNYNFNGDEYY